MPRHLLIVDDDDRLAENLAAFFEDAGIPTLRAKNGAEALAIVESGRAAVALIDFRLGAESGFDVLRALREVRPHFPVVLMSAYFDDWLEGLLRAYADLPYIQKPFSPAEVLAVARRALSPGEAA